MARNLGVPYTDKPPYYFISYNSEDEARVRKYAAKLSEHKVPMWYDHGIKVGNEFEIEIAEKIDNCGDYLNGKRTGRGKYTYADGRVKEGIFENGVFKG